MVIFLYLMNYLWLWIVPTNQHTNKMSTNNNTNTLLDGLLLIAKNEWGIEPDSLKEIIDMIAYHESKRTMNPKIHQIGGGQGRGMLQYEKTYKDKKTGKYGQAGGMTGRNRLASLLKEYHGDLNVEDSRGYSIDSTWGEIIPDWLIQKGMRDPKIGFDVSKLSKDRQYSLFIADKLKDPSKSASLKGINPSDLLKVANFWADEHWKGDASKRPYEIVKFLGNMVKRKFSKQTP